MREIKFRAWDSENKEMFFPSSVSWKGEHMWVSAEMGIHKFGYEVNKPSADNLMQYTGLKDKNGKEIYEGDIIRKTMRDKPFSRNSKDGLVNFVIEWDDGKRGDNQKEPKFYCKEIGNSKFGSCAWSPLTDCELIGNIYENPELLKENP